jgi:hypothetical protein
MRRINRGGKRGLKLIQGDRSGLEDEFRTALIEFVIRDGRAHERAKKKLYEIDDRLSRRADLRLVGSSETSLSDTDQG